MALVHALAKVSIELDQILLLLSSQIIFSAQKGECFLNDFEALVREIYVCG
jgi:hypothetical protein